MPDQPIVQQSHCSVGHRQQQRAKFRHCCCRLTATTVPSSSGVQWSLSGPHPADMGINLTTGMFLWQNPMLPSQATSMPVMVTIVATNTFGQVRC